MDESPTKEGPARAWLWTAVAPTFAVFAICLSRAATAIGQLLGDRFTGTINCDRAKMDWHVGRLQWCWAHLQRDIQALIEHPDSPCATIGTRSDEAGHRDVPTLARISCRHDLPAYISPPYGTGARHG